MPKKKLATCEKCKQTFQSNLMGWHLESCGLVPEADELWRDIQEHGGVSGLAEKYNVGRATVNRHVKSLFPEWWKERMRRRVERGPCPRCGHVFILAHIPHHRETYCDSMPLPAELCKEYARTNMTALKEKYGHDENNLSRRMRLAPNEYKEAKRIARQRKNVVSKKRYYNCCEVCDIRLDMDTGDELSMTNVAKHNNKMCRECYLRSVGDESLTRPKSYSLQSATIVSFHR